MVQRKAAAQKQPMKYPHVQHHCADPSCYVCRHGLFQCAVCLAAEGELLHDCPGVALSFSAREACFEGQVISIQSIPRRLATRHFLRAAGK